MQEHALDRIAALLSSLYCITQENPILGMGGAALHLGQNRRPPATMVRLLTGGARVA